MENTLNIIDDFDISANVFQPFDISNCILPPDLERCETIREYFYYTGYTGPTGPTGMTGPRGISKQENTFMTVYNTTLQQILPNSPVIFETNNCCYGSCFHSPNTSQIFIWRTGYYSIYINLFHLESSQFSLYKNGIIVPGTAIGSLSGLGIGLMPGRGRLRTGLPTRRLKAPRRWRPTLNPSSSTL
jgi:hypothetical protein